VIHPGDEEVKPVAEAVLGLPRTVARGVEDEPCPQVGAADTVRPWGGDKWGEVEPVAEAVPGLPRAVAPRGGG
jgi:hypothetical protein